MEPVAVITCKGNKRQLPTGVSDYSKCTICQTIIDDQRPLYNLKRGFTTYKNAVEIRKDYAYTRVWEDLQNQDQFQTSLDYFISLSLKM
ncbi:hypothetical protein SK128_022482, partial [Halocaridina rubra]